MSSKAWVILLPFVLFGPLSLPWFARAAENTAKAAPDYQTALHLFDYEAKRPLDIHDKIIEEFDGGSLHEITYTSPKGGPVAAYLVVPKGKGPFAAILFGHWGNGTRAEFIPEAKLYARAGAVSLMPDYPWDRPQPWHKTPDHYDKPELDREIEIQVVVDLRRGIDLLLARADIDPKRLAYVGHSYGAQWGAILSAVDRRMKTSVLMAGLAEIADIFLRASDPGMVEFRKSRPPGQLERYAQITSDIDAIHFVGHAGPIPLLFQFANFEQYFDKTSMDHYVAAASDPKKVLYYDTGHDLNDPQALEDRYDWLAKHIDLRRVPILSLAGDKKQKIDSTEFAQLMQTVADSWNKGDARKAADCFAENAVYSEPPDKQLYKGRIKLFKFFGGNEGRKSSMKMTWHHLVFNEQEQIGAGEFTFESGSKVHGVAMIKIAEGKISHWREYWYESDLDWEKFIGENKF